MDEETNTLITPWLRFTNSRPSSVSNWSRAPFRVDQQVCWCARLRCQTGYFIKSAKGIVPIDLVISKERSERKSYAPISRYG